MSSYELPDSAIETIYGDTKSLIETAITETFAAPEINKYTDTEHPLSFRMRVARNSEVVYEYRDENTQEFEVNASMIKVAYLWELFHNTSELGITLNTQIPLNVLGGYIENIAEEIKNGITITTDDLTKRILRSHTHINPASDTLGDDLKALTISVQDIIEATLGPSSNHGLALTRLYIDHLINTTESLATFRKEENSPAADLVYSRIQQRQKSNGEKFDVGVRLSSSPQRTEARNSSRNGDIAGLTQQIFTEIEQESNKDDEMAKIFRNTLNYSPLDDETIAPDERAIAAEKRNSDHEGRHGAKESLPEGTPIYDKSGMVIYYITPDNTIKPNGWRPFIDIDMSNAIIDRDNKLIGVCHILNDTVRFKIGENLYDIDFSIAVPFKSDVEYDSDNDPSSSTKSEEMVFSILQPKIAAILKEKIIELIQVAKAA